jgi:hypothetical protein
MLPSTRPPITAALLPMAGQVVGEGAVSAGEVVRVPCGLGSLDSFGLQLRKEGLILGGGILGPSGGNWSRSQGPAMATITLRCPR